MRKMMLGAVALAGLVLAACSPVPEPTEAMPETASEEMAEEEMEEEVMAEEDDEMMAEDEMSDSEMMEDAMSMDPITFVVRIENTASADGLTVLSPGAYELNDHPLAFFDVGQPDRGQGLEAIAEDGDPSALVATIDEMMSGDEMPSFMIGAFNTPVGADGPGPAGPGAAYEFTVEAYPGQYLTFATMFVQSNDWFFSPDVEGIALFDDEGNPISGDITDLVYLWNAGTEADQTVGEGPDQAPRQAGPNTGEDEGGTVIRVEDFADYQILVTITPQA